jgi:branched-chain amino acid aminotransferase
VTPVREIDGRRIGSGTCGPITRSLQERFFAIIRGTATTHPHRDWLTTV